MDWLITVSFAAAVSTLVWYVNAPADKYKLGLLSVFYWGTTLMVFVDHLVGSILEKGNFMDLKMTSEGWVVSSAMIVTPLTIWVIILVLTDPKRIWRKE